MESCFSNFRNNYNINKSFRNKTLVMNNQNRTFNIILYFRHTLLLRTIYSNVNNKNSIINNNNRLGIIIMIILTLLLMSEAATRGVLKSFLVFTGKHLCWSLFIINLQAFYWQETLTQVFLSGYCEIFKNSFIIERFWWLLLNLSLRLVV